MVAELVLGTERLLLRDMREEDAAPLSAYQSRASYLAHYATKPDTRAIVAAAIEWAKETPRVDFQLAVVLASSATVIGCAGLRQRGYPKGEAEVGIEIDPKYWRRGFAKETLRELIRFGTSELAIGSFWAVTTPSNRRARLLVEQFGFVERDETGDTLRMQLRVRANASR